MQPIYEDLIKMWKENGFDYEIYPGTFWLDNSIVKAYDKKGNLKYLYKVMIADDLSVTFKKHSNCPDYTDFNFETWEMVYPELYTKRISTLLEWWSGKRTTNKRNNRRIYAIQRHRQLRNC